MNGLSHPWSRLAGVLLAAVILFVLDTESTAVLHALLLPLALTVAGWLMTRSLMAVAFATFTMAAISTRFGAASWIPAIAYPAIAGVALLVCLHIITQRFRQRIAETHEQRWAHRRARTVQEQSDDDRAP